MDNLETEIAGIASLNEPVRRALYLFVASRREGAGRDEAAGAVSVTRALAAFHLDRLVEEGLLDAQYRRLSGRSGPGAGRPAKVYRRSGRQLSLSLPARNYELAARVMGRALLRAEGSSGEALAGAARELGEALGESARLAAGGRPGREGLLAAAVEVLDGHGFEPWRDGDVVRLRNCPFRSLAEEFPDLVCGMNLAFMGGFLTGLRARGLETGTDALPGACCVVFQAVRSVPSR